MTSPALSCQVCDAELHDGNAHFPHDRGCTRKGCACDNKVCTACCWDAGCVAIRLAAAQEHSAFARFGG